MRIASGFPTCDRNVNSSHLEAINSNRGILAPLSLIYPAATLEQNGHKVKIIEVFLS